MLYDRVVEELLLTEASFMDTLKIIEKVQQESCDYSILSQSESQALFGPVVRLKAAHEPFLAKLRERTQTGTVYGVAVADLIQGLLAEAEPLHTAFFLWAIDFEEHFNTLLSTNKRFKAFVAGWQARPEARGIHPISMVLGSRGRFFKYGLLVRELAKTRPEDEQLQSVFALVDSAMKRANDTIRDEGRNRRTAAVAKLFHSDISKPGRFFVASFPAEECDGFDLGRGEMCYAFNDAVLCTRKREGDKKLEVVAELPASSCCEVVSVPPTRSPCQFKLTFRTDEKVVIGTTVEQMGTWTLKTELGLPDSVLP